MSRTIAASADPDLKKQIGTILAGKGSIRDLTCVESFNRTIPIVVQRYSQMTDAQRNQLAEQAQAGTGKAAQPTTGTRSWARASDARS
ncbi:hypothetical protein ACIBJI_10740 [Nocardia sp. NPDC050408]|uniref:hypothetical protein n=1 Tax=unclassified Nocardia TaxID=2637762 RepID=UPI00344ABCB1